MIAIRYQLPNGMVGFCTSPYNSLSLKIYQIRRLQINFNPTSGYDKAVEILHMLSLPIENRDVESEDQPPVGPVPDIEPAVPSAGPLGFLPAQSSSEPRNHTSTGRLQTEATLRSGSNLLNVGVSNPAEARSGATDTTRRSLFQREIAETRRPVTAPTPVSADTLSQLLPPKRILPFPDPPAKSKRQENKSDVARSRSDAVGKETAVTKKQKTTTKGAVPKTKAAAVCGTNRSTMAPPGSSTPVVGRKQVDLSIRTSGDTRPPGSLKQRAEVTDTLGGSGNNEPSAHRLKTAIEQDGHAPKQANQSSGLPVSADWVAEVDNFMRERRKGPGPAGAVEDTLTIELKDRVDTFMEEHRDCVTAVDPTYTYPPASGLAEFAKLSKEERSAAMDALIVECLNDEEFMGLVDEVDDSWERVGLRF